MFSTERQIMKLNIVDVLSPGYFSQQISIFF